jgi:hypothetical protein
MYDCYKVRPNQSQPIIRPVLTAGMQILQLSLASATFIIIILTPAIKDSDIGSMGPGRDDTTSNDDIKLVSNMARPTT